MVTVWGQRPTPEGSGLGPVLAGEPVFRSHTPIDCGVCPESDDPGGVHISMGLMTTHAALEFRLALAVALVAVAALGARPGAVAGVDSLERDPSQRRLVLHERPQLSERPAAHPRSLPLAKPSPVADALEILHPNTASGVFGLCNELLADLVVDVPLVPRLLPLGSHDRLVAVPPLAPLGSPGCLAQRSSPGSVLDPLGLDLLRGVLGPVAVHGDVDHAQVHADEVRRGRLGPVRDIDRDQQEPLAVLAEHQVALTLGVGKPFGLILPHDEWYEDSSIQGQQAHFIRTLERHHPLVQWHRGMVAKPRPLVLVALVGFADLRD